MSAIRKFPTEWATRIHHSSEHYQNSGICFNMFARIADKKRRYIESFGPNLLCLRLVTRVYNAIDRCVNEPSSFRATIKKEKLWARWNVRRVYACCPVTYSATDNSASWRAVETKFVGRVTRRPSTDLHALHCCVTRASSRRHALNCHHSRNAASL